MLNEVEFREVQEIMKIDKVKIVACDGKSKCFRLLTNDDDKLNLCFFVDVSEEGGSKK